MSKAVNKQGSLYAKDTYKLTAEEEEQLEKLKEQGNSAFHAGEFSKSIELFTAAMKIHPKHHILFSNRSASYSSLKMFDLALKDADICISLAPDWLKGYLRKGTALYGLGQLAEAEKAYLKGYGGDASNPEYLNKMKSLGTDKTQSNSLRLKGLYHLQKGHFADALPWFEKALTILPHDQELNIHRTACAGCVQIGRPDGQTMLYGCLLQLSKLKLKNRWFSVQGTTFSYYPENDPKKPKYVLPLMGAKVSNVTNKEFCLTGPISWPKCFRCKAGTPEDRLIWVNALLGAISCANSKIDIIPTSDMNTVWSQWAPQKEHQKEVDGSFQNGGVGLA